MSSRNHPDHQSEIRASLIDKKTGEVLAKKAQMLFPGKEIQQERFTDGDICSAIRGFARTLHYPDNNSDITATLFKMRWVADDQEMKIQRSINKQHQYTQEDVQGFPLLSSQFQAASKHYQQCPYFSSFSTPNKQGLQKRNAIRQNEKHRVTQRQSKTAFNYEKENQYNKNEFEQIVKQETSNHSLPLFNPLANIKFGNNLNGGNTPNNFQQPNLINADQNQFSKQHTNNNHIYNNNNIKSNQIQQSNVEHNQVIQSRYSNQLGFHSLNSPSRNNISNQCLSPLLQNQDQFQEQQNQNILQENFQNENPIAVSAPPVINLCRQRRSSLTSVQQVLNFNDMSQYPSSGNLFEDHQIIFENEKDIDCLFEQKDDLEFQNLSYMQLNSQFSQNLLQGQPSDLQDFEDMLE